MSNVLIIGAGAVGNVTTQKCAQAPEVFDEIWLASRRLEKCNAIAARTAGKVETAQVDANNAHEVTELIRACKPDVVINVALPFQNLAIMDACLETGVDYLDTAAYEPPDQTVYSYKWQWVYHDRFADKGLMGVLGCGFDPGVTNVFCRYARDKYMDELRYVDIVDCNAGDHGQPFATNFNPEVNIREITQPGKYFDSGDWITVSPLSESIEFDFPEIGRRKAYLIYHEELDSLVKYIPTIRRIRFYMTFTDSYISHLRAFENVGLTSIEPIEFEGRPIIPLKFLEALLPDPASLAPNYKGKTCIGCVMEGIKEGQPVKLFIYNLCDHQEAYREVQSQAISYTAGVPPMIGAMLMVQGKWRAKGVYNPEQLDPVPFMDALNRHGLPWTETRL